MLNILVVSWEDVIECQRKYDLEAYPDSYDDDCDGLPRQQWYIYADIQWNMYNLRDCVTLSTTYKEDIRAIWHDDEKEILTFSKTTLYGKEYYNVSYWYEAQERDNLDIKFGIVNPRHTI